MSSTTPGEGTPESPVTLTIPPLHFNFERNLNIPPIPLARLDLPHPDALNERAATLLQPFFAYHAPHPPIVGAEYDVPPLPEAYHVGAGPDQESDFKHT